MQPELGKQFDPNELNRIIPLVDYITHQGGKAILDPHNYAKYNRDPLSNPTQWSYFQDFWSRLASVPSFKNNPNVIFALMNEPIPKSKYAEGVTTEEWLSAANAGIAGIRSSGANNLILVPGNGWTGAHSWQQNWYGTPNAQVMIPSNIKDPGNNFAYDVHQYFDWDYSGQSSVCKDFEASSMMDPFTSWARQNKVKGMVTEFGVANNPQCLQTLDAMVNYMKQNSDVYSGYTYWAGGPNWGGYMYSIEPDNLQSGPDKPQMGVLQKYF